MARRGARVCGWPVPLHMGGEGGPPGPARRGTRVGGRALQGAEEGDPGGRWMGPHACPAGRGAGDGSFPLPCRERLNWGRRGHHQRGHQLRAVSVASATRVVPWGAARRGREVVGREVGWQVATRWISLERG